MLHIRYTAREGGEALRKPGLQDLKEKLDEAQALGSIRLLSFRHDFPTAWAAYKAAAQVGDFRPLKITLTPQHYPFWSQTGAGETRQVVKAELIARAAGEVKVARPDGTNADTLGAFIGGLRRAEITQAPKPPFVGEWHVGLTGDGVEDAWLLIHWGAVA